MHFLVKFHRLFSPDVMWNFSSMSLFQIILILELDMNFYTFVSCLVYMQSNYTNLVSTSSLIYIQRVESNLLDNKNSRNSCFDQGQCVLTEGSCVREFSISTNIRFQWFHSLVYVVFIFYDVPMFILWVGLKWPLITLSLTRSN